MFERPRRSRHTQQEANGKSLTLFQECLVTFIVCLMVEDMLKQMEVGETHGLRGMAKFGSASCMLGVVVDVGLDESA